MAYNPNNPNGQATSANSAPVVLASDQSAVPVTDNGGSITVDGTVGVSGTVTVTGTVTANAGTGTQNVSVQNASIPVTDNGGSLTVDGSVSVSNFPATQAVSGAVTVSQATAANLNANVTVQNASIPVTDNGGSLTVDGTVAATQSGTWNINNISGTVSLPTGAATSANQSTMITALQLLDNVVATDGSAALTSLYQVGGTDGTNAQILSTNVSGHLNIADGGNSITVDGTVTANAGTGTFAVSGTVTANAGTGTMNVSVQNASIPVTDNGGSLTVDGTVAATQSGTWSVRTQDGSGNAVTSRTAGSTRPFDVAIVDGSGNQVTSFGGGTQYADGAAVATPTGTATLGWDGTAVQVIRTDSSGVLAIQDNGGSITVDGSVSVSNFPATQAVSATNLDIRDLTATDVVTVTGGAGQTADVKVTLDSEQVAISNFPATQAVSGTVTVQDGGGSITVDGTVAATQSGTWSTRTQDGAGNAVTSRATGSSRPFDVAIVDGSGNQVTSFGGGVQYEDGDLPGTPTGTLVLGLDGTNVHALNTDDVGKLNVNITLPYGIMDTFGNLRMSESHNDIDVQFYRDDPDNILTTTAASGGTAVQSAGFATFSTSTAATGSIKGVTLDTTHYHSGSEVYSMFAVAFPTGGVATSFQRIGLFDNSNGFYVGYENTTFGVTVRKGSSNTFIDKASWNVDTLVGAAGSKFTRFGTPEAIDFTKLNVFRIRFGWLGAAAVKYEVLSPDNEWVLFHVIKQPNTSDLPHIETADLPMTVELTKTAGATNIQLYTTCWGAGVQYNTHDWTNTSTLGTAIGSLINYDINNLSAVTLYINTTTTGTFDIEGTIDGKNWFRHPFVVDYNSQGQALLRQEPITPVNTSFYKMSVAGLRGLRLRTTATLGASVIVAFVGVKEEGQYNIGNAPHNIGYATVWKSGEYSTTQTGVALWTPASGHKIAVTDMTISTGGTTSGIVTIWQGSAADTTYTAGTDPVIFRGEFAPSATAKPGMVKTFSVPFVTTTNDHIIRVTTSAAMTVYVQLTGYEI